MLAVPSLLALALLLATQRWTSCGARSFVLPLTAEPGDDHEFARRFADAVLAARGNRGALLFARDNLPASLSRWHGRAANASVLEWTRSCFVAAPSRALALFGAGRSVRPPSCACIPTTPGSCGELERAVVEFVLEDAYDRIPVLDERTRLVLVGAW